MSEPSLVVQMCEVTGCTEETAAEVLQRAGQDLAVAVDRFYREQGRLRDNKDKVGKNVNLNVNEASSSCGMKRKADDMIIIDDDSDETVSESCEDSIAHENKVVEKTRDANLVAKFLSKYEMMQEDLKSSAKKHNGSKEPTPEANFQVLSGIYPQLDQAALRNLCREYAGRSGELEKFVQFHIHDIPTKLEVEKTKLQRKIDEIKAAGKKTVEDADKMIVEDCPKCQSPRIITDPTAKVFTCMNPACKGEFCRKCKLEQHIPFKCKGQIFINNIDFQVINILPKRMYDETDPLDKEFRIAEGQFLRMNSITKRNYEITSIDVVYNKKLEGKFLKKKEEFSINGGQEGCLLLFHGTPQQNIQLILKNNFDLSIRTNGRSYGDGVYFSECPEVSLGYSRDQKSLILCKVLMGKNCREVKVAPNARKVDTRCWAVVVPDVDQILPSYVINFTGGRG